MFVPEEYQRHLNSMIRVRYCRDLEEGSFRGRTADFAWMLMLGAATIMVRSSHP